MTTFTLTAPFYVLNDRHEVVTCDDARTWGEFFEDTVKRRVAETTIPPRRGRRGWWISTVFLGIDHGYFGGPPLLFETMIFANDGRYALPRRVLHRRMEYGGRKGRSAARRLRGDPVDWQRRVATWREALAVHKQAVRVASRGYA